MTLEQLQRLARNPSYKLSQAQKDQLEKHTKKPTKLHTQEVKGSAVTTNPVLHDQEEVENARNKRI